jgi:hypothetical protein
MRVPVFRNAEGGPIRQDPGHATLPHEPRRSSPIMAQPHPPDPIVTELREIQSALAALFATVNNLIRRIDDDPAPAGNVVDLAEWRRVRGGAA